jgi:hypothetical protein
LCGIADSLDIVLDFDRAEAVADDQQEDIVEAAALAPLVYLELVVSPQEVFPELEDAHAQAVFPELVALDVACADAGADDVDECPLVCEDQPSSTISATYDR